MKRPLLPSFIALCSASSIAAFAQARRSALTLDEAIARGLEASHRLAEIGAREDAARAVEDQRKAAAHAAARAAGRLHAHQSCRRVRRAHAAAASVIYPDIPDNLRSRIDLQWPIYTGGRTAR